MASLLTLAFSPAMPKGAPVRAVRQGAARFAYIGDVDVEEAGPHRRAWAEIRGVGLLCNQRSDNNVDQAMRAIKKKLQREGYRELS